MAPVGLTMYLIPAQVAGLWPWAMPIIDVRLLGSIFLASAILSGWGIVRGRRRAEIDPLLAAYAGFASLALMASVAHVALFDAHRAMTWVLSLSDGRSSLLDIAERSKLPFAMVHEAASQLFSHDLLSPVDG